MYDLYDRELADSSSYDIYDQELADYRRALFGGSPRIAGNYEDLYHCPVFDPNVPFQEGILDLMSSLYGTQEVDFSSRPWEENGLTEEVYEEEQLAYDGNWNWPSCFSDCQGENFFSLEEDTQDIVCGSSSWKMEDFSHGEELHDSYFSYHEDGENWSVCDYYPWNAYKGEEEFHDFCRQEPRIPYDYNLDEMRLCEGIFGYWPCLFREKPKNTW